MPPSRARTRPARPSGHRLAALVCVAVLVGAAGCSGDSEEPSGTGGSSGAAQATTDVRTTARLGRVTGDLDRERRSRVRDQARRVVGRWFEAAYTGGDWPRRGTARAYPGFTTGAAAQARADRALTSNAVLGPRLEDAVARRAAVTVDVLATGGRARALTARFALSMALTGDLGQTGEREERVTGRLYLTPDASPGGQGWQVVGYDVQRGTEREEGR